MDELFSIVLRSSAVYLFIIVAIRIFGKRELSQLSVIDLVFILLISNSVQNAMVGQNTSLLGGILAATSLFVINLILETLVFRSKKVSGWIQGDALMLVYQGKVLPSHLEKARISLEELEAAVREHGVADIKKVDLAVLESDGNISVLSDNYRHKTVRRRKAHKIIIKDS